MTSVPSYSGSRNSGEVRPTLVGLAAERRVLAAAIRDRKSLLLLGPPGSGKTALLKSVLDWELRGTPVALIQSFDRLHDLLTAIARELLRSGHRGFRHAAGRLPGDWGRWLAGQTSIHLKGLLWNALEREPVPIILDGINGSGHPTYRFLQRLYFTRGMALIAATRDPVRLGELGRLFWDPRCTLHVQPLPDTEARRLFEASAEWFGLNGLMLDDFREKALDSAMGNPGQIVEMCRFAANPKYVTDGHRVKFAPLRIDVLTKFL